MTLKRIPVPTGIELAEEGRRIVLSWPDGEVTEHAAYDLRAECPCAVCVDELTGRRILSRDRVDPGVRALDFGRIGRYAVQFRWSDGHSTGIYSYERLRGETA